MLFDDFREDQVNRCSELLLDASGKGVNVSRILQQLGNNVFHLTALGGRDSSLFLSLCKQSNIEVSFAESDSQVRYCSTLINKHNNTTTEIIEPTLPVGKDAEEKVLNLFYSLLPYSHTLIISGTKAPGFSDRIYPQMVLAAKKASVTIILDVKGNDLLNSLPYSPDFIKPNLSEFAESFLDSLKVWENETSQELEMMVSGKMGDIFKTHGTKSILTRGSRGCLYHDGYKIHAVEANLIQPVNTIGCGDAFTAGFASAWYKSGDLDAAVLEGMETARLNALCLRPGSIR